MTDNISYLAGLIDGEGSIGYYSTGQNIIFTIEVKMTSELIIDWLITTYGGRKHTRRPEKTGYKEQYRWRIVGKQALKLYAELAPHLKLKAITF